MRPPLARTTLCRWEALEGKVLGLEDRDVESASPSCAVSPSLHHPKASLVGAARCRTTSKRLSRVGAPGPEARRDGRGRQPEKARALCRRAPHGRACRGERGLTSGACWTTPGRSLRHLLTQRGAAPVGRSVTSSRSLRSGGRPNLAAVHPLPVSISSLRTRELCPDSRRVPAHAQHTEGADGDAQWR